MYTNVMFKAFSLFTHGLLGNLIYKKKKKKKKKISFFQDEQLKELHNMIEMEEEGCEAKFKQVFEQLQSGKGPSWMEDK
jgi:hypothetical protein